MPTTQPKMQHGPIHSGMGTSWTATPRLNHCHLLFRSPPETLIVSNTSSSVPHTIACLAQNPFNFFFSFLEFVPLPLYKLVPVLMPLPLVSMRISSCWEILSISYVSRREVWLRFGVEVAELALEPSFSGPSSAILMASSLYREGMRAGRALVTWNSLMGLPSDPDPRWYQAHAAAFTVAKGSRLTLDFLLSMDIGLEVLWKCGVTRYKDRK